MAVNPYQIQRNRVAQESQATSAQENEALKRRFARMGGLQGGSYIKAQERLSGIQEQNKQKAIESVDVQESLAQEQKDEAERGRQFARGERLGSQEFAAGESAIGRRFAAEEAQKGRSWQTGEREAGQTFQLGYLGKQQDFARGEREASQLFASKERGEAQDYAATQAELGRRWQTSEAQATRNLQSSQFDKQFAADQEVNKFNQIIASIQAGSSSEDIRKWYQALFQGGERISPLDYQFVQKPSPNRQAASQPNYSSTQGQDRGGGFGRGGRGGAGIGYG